ncbi:hypothetical protein [Pantoea sp. CCBC3-3-1]|uniref:hypothetical protein n=1 Tax=Pantoea sp. CCBC3-3-1 TaxID=2490851 RepID=UPI0011BE9E66|nr:hypothetical protein [Pantoea sp. CCBC3-3-1]
MSEHPDGGVLSTTEFDVLCGGNRVKVPPRTAIPWLAQCYAAALYRNDFRRRYPGGEIYPESDIRLVGTGQAFTDRALAIIVKELRNYYAKNKRNRDLIAKGRPPAELTEGRALRPDVLGLALDNYQATIVCELLEVSTVDQAENTIKGDLEPKLALLRGPVKTFVDDWLSGLALNSSAPKAFIANGAPWIIPPELMIVPIFPQPGTAIASFKYRWICFGPTYNYRPMPIGNFQLEDPASPARGLILYSYHEAVRGAPVPVEVFEKLTKWLEEQKKRETRLELLPLGDYHQYWRDNSADLKRMLGYLAVGVTAVAVVALAIFLAPVVAGAASALLSNLALAATAEATALEMGAVIAALSNTLPALMRTAHNILSSANNMGSLATVR